MVICLEQGAALHMAQLMPLPLTVSCSSKIQIGFTFLVPAHPGGPGQRAVKWVRVCVCSYPLGPQQQTECTLLQRANGRDRRTDQQRTDTVPLHRPCSAYSADNLSPSSAIIHWNLRHAVSTENPPQKTRRLC